MTPLDYTLRLIRYGFAIWVRLLGRRRATRLMVGGFVVCGVVAVVLQVTT